MRRAYFIGAGLLLALAVGLFLVAQALRAERQYDVRGRVAGFGTDGRTVFVEHETIPGYMPAMTMPFTVRDTIALQGLETGDAVSFRLHVTLGRSWIAGVKELVDTAVVEHPAGASTVAARLRMPDSLRILDEGDRVSTGLALTSQSGEAFTLQDYRGRALVVTFIYTRCPLPDYCPLMSKHFAALQPMLKKTFGKRAQLLSVTFDPAYDTPAVLRDYAARYTDDLSTWTFATGTLEAIGRMTQHFGVFPLDEGTQIVHNLTTALIGPEGRVKEIWRGNDWMPEEVLRAVRQTLRSDSMPP